MAEMERKDYFKYFSKIDVSPYVEQKNGFDYLKWAWAEKTVRQVIPDLVLRVNEQLAIPCPQGYMVQVSIRFDQEEHCEYYPVTDYRNKAILDPDSFDINMAIKRAHTKLIARILGLGIDLFLGESVAHDKTNTAKTPTRATVPPKRVSPSATIAQGKPKMKPYLQETLDLASSYSERGPAARETMCQLRDTWLMANAPNGEKTIAELANKSPGLLKDFYEFLKDDVGPRLDKVKEDAA